MSNYDTLASERMVTAIEQGNFGDFQSAIEDEADPNYDPLGSQNSPLLMALSYGHEDMALILLAEGANVNAQNALGRTPLHMAASSGMKAFVEKALEKPEIKRVVFDKKNQTAADFAEGCGFDDIAVLINTKVKPSNLESFTIDKTDDKSTQKAEVKEPQNQAVRKKMVFGKKS